MNRNLIVFGTITYALKAKDLLRRNGIKATVERISTGKNGKGCSYAVIFEGDALQVKDVLQNAGIKNFNFAKN